MKPALFPSDIRIFRSPEHGGHTVTGGRPNANPDSSGEEEVLDALGFPSRGHAKIPGTGDPGVPGSRTNPVGHEDEKEEEQESES